MTLVGTLLLSATVSVAAAPCDIFAAAGTPCVAAHSTTRSLFSAFSSSLYQVSRASDGKLKDIPVVAPGGVANSAVQDTFCSSTTCTISRMYVCPPYMDFFVSLAALSNSSFLPTPLVTHLSAPLSIYQPYIAMIRPHWAMTWLLPLSTWDTMALTWGQMHQRTL